MSVYLQVFKEILEELKELIAEEKNPTSVSAKDAKPVEDRELDNEWLQGTNINVTKVTVFSVLLTVKLLHSLSFIKNSNSGKSMCAVKH